MHQDPPSSSPAASAGSSGIESLQQQTIRAFTWVLLLLVTPILAGLHLTELFLGRYDAALAAQGLAHLVTCLLILVVRPLRGRALVAIVVLAISALMILLHYGPTLTAGLLYFMAVLLGSLFFGGRAVTWILAVVLGSIFAAGAVHVYFGSSLGDSRIADPQRMGTWIRTALVSVPVLAILAVLVHWFFEGMKRNIRAAEVALARERAERGEKERMAEARHKAERALSEAQRQDLIGRLAASASHDLNNVLTAILGGVELAVLDLEAGKGDTAREMLEQIEAAAQRASAMGRQLLSFSRQQHTQPRNVDWHELVAGLRGLLQRLLPSNIALDTTVRDDVVVVFADPSQLEQLIMNLVVNARDAMPDGGRVSLLVENARGSGGESGVSLSVEDTGTGIAADVREQIFDPYFTTKERGRGTGLGLATVKTIVEELQGAIAVDSEVGRGTTFRIWLPASQQADPEAALEHPPVAGTRARGTERVLLADDDPAIREISTRVLVGAGYRVETAQDGQQLLEELERGGYDLVILDAVMPGPSGSKLVRHLESHFPGLGILFSTGYDPGVFGAGFFADGSRRLLCKPYRRAELLAAVRSVLDARAR